MAFTFLFERPHPMTEVSVDESDAIVFSEMLMAMTATAVLMELTNPEILQLIPTSTSYWMKYAGKDIGYWRIEHDIIEEHGDFIITSHCNDENYFFSMIQNDEETQSGDLDFSDFDYTKYFEPHEEAKREMAKTILAKDWRTRVYRGIGTDLCSVELQAFIHSTESHKLAVN